MKKEELRLLNMEIDRLYKVSEKKFNEWREANMELASKLADRHKLVS